MGTSTTVEKDRLAFGEFLRQARERRRLTLEQIAGETKIAPRLLTSLEQGDVQPMPKGMYRRAMLRAYAESVGLDPQAALTEFERTFEEPPPRDVPLPALPAPTTAQPTLPRPASERRILPLALGAIGLAAAVTIGAWVLWDDADPAAAPRNAAAAPAPSAVPAVATTPAPDPVKASLGATATSGVAEPVAAPGDTPARPLATEGQLTVVSDPPGARVTVNGVGWGSTPLTIQYLPLGAKRVRITKDGYVSQERSVRVDGQNPRATVNVTLATRP